MKKYAPLICAAVLLCLFLVVLFAQEVPVAVPQPVALPFKSFCILHSEMEVYATYLQNEGLADRKMFLLKSHEEVGLKALQPMYDQFDELYLIVDDLAACGITEVFRFTPPVAVFHEK